MEIKYTKDGKKVVVIGKLNNAESIVQEIFVSEGQEMPGGENFIATGLLDAPSKSWKRSQVEEWDRQYVKLKVSLEKLQVRERKERSFACAVEKILDSYKDVKEIGQLLAFLNNEIEYIVQDGDIYSLQSKLVQTSDYGQFEDLKLLTLFGSSKIGLRWKLNRWSDGSGCSTEVYPAKSLDDAKQYLELQIKNKDNIGESDIKVQEKYQLKYPSIAQLRKYHQGLVRSKKKYIKDVEIRLATYKQELKNLKEQ